MKDEIIIREAKTKDSEAIAKLGIQLGKEVTAEEIEKRLKEMDSDTLQETFVAEENGTILGWVNVTAYNEILSGTQARIGGLVVDINTRGKGIGRKLMEKTEEWARDKGSKSMKLSSNTKRTEAHTFYEKIGYTKVKEQASFKKDLKEKK